MENILLVTEHIAKKGNKTLKFLKTSFGKPTFVDNEGGCWRLCEYLDNSVNLDGLAITPETYVKSGRALADFQRSLMDFDASRLFEVIPNFHNTVSRFSDFETAVAENKSGRAENAQDEIKFVRDHEKLSKLIVDRLEGNKIPLRVTHNDTKLSNIMVDKTTHDVICFIDLDTVMPGSILYDFGDALRMAGSSAAEDEKDLTKVHFIKKNFENFCKGYVSAAKDFLSDEELSLLPESVAVMTYECGMRFLGDYINGDTYFHTSYPEHNLVRARNQFKLVADMEESFDELHEIVKKCM